MPDPHLPALIAYRHEFDIPAFVRERLRFPLESAQELLLQATGHCGRGRGRYNSAAGPQVAIAQAGTRIERSFGVSPRTADRGARSGALGTRRYGLR